MIWLSIFASLFGQMFMGVWLGVALGISGIIIMQVWGGGVPLLASSMWSVLNVYGLTALPIFIFMGQIILHSGISGRIYDSVSPFLARFPGKLIHSNIVVNAMFAAVFGSSTACAAAIGSVAIPELRKRKYDDKMVLGSVCTAGTLGIMIPPSGPLITYGSVVGVSIAALFAAAMVPGLMMVGLYMAYVAIRGVVTPQIAPTDEKVPALGASLRPLLKIWPLIIIMIACIAPIYAGLATAPESAGIGSLASIIIGSTVGKLKRKTLWMSVSETTKITSMLFFIILGAMILARAVSTLGLPRLLVEQVSALSLSPPVLLAGIYIMYVVLGCFFDGLSMMLMTLPFIYPIIGGLGFDTVWFGVLMVLQIEIGQVTPPVGLNLYVVQSIAGGKTTIGDVFKGSAPFLLCTLTVLALITIFPGVVHWFPNLLHL